MKQHIIFDCELIGKIKPVFLTCCKIKETGETFSFWHDKRGHTAKLEKLLLNTNYTWIGFNSVNFDAPLIAAAIMGHDELDLKHIAQRMIDERMRSWQTYREFNIDFIEYDHIDLIETAPSVMISLKTYAGRMACPSMVDMPFHHDDEINTPAKRKIVENYCLNDLGVTEALFDKLSTELALRVELGAEYGIDLRSKSDAQCAEAILKKQVGIGNGDKFVPRYVEYTAPKFIKPKSKTLKGLVELFESEKFTINRGNGSPEEAAWMNDPVTIGDGIYKVGLGGLHSQHDKNFYLEATDDLLISDFDVASYYPNIMMVAGLIPKLGGNKGQLFLDEYRHIYEQRMKAKRAGNKIVANTLKILLNGTFGKLGSIYCSFYSPDLLIAVTITGQLNLLCLIEYLEKLKGVSVKSANTDGVTVVYPPAQREAVLKVFTMNAKRTGFEYEETPYQTVAMKDVNSYIAICVDGKVKTKGLYAKAGLMKNPTMQVCSDAAVAYLKDGVSPEMFIRDAKSPEDFVAIRNVKGGGVQHKKLVLVDDWVLWEDKGSKDNIWMRQAHLDAGRSPWDQGGGGCVIRKSRPKPIEKGVGGTPFGRVARWYMTTEALPPLSYVESGNKVPSTDGAKLCMTLPDVLPADLDRNWYIQNTYDILKDLGVPL